jgi:hypothetical protein
MTFDDAFLDAAHKHSFANRAELKGSQFCGCFSCFAIFPPSDIWEWIQEGDDQDRTGFCPYCMLDTVIGDASGLPVQDEDLLSAMNEKFFGGPPFFDQRKDPVPISKPGDWKQMRDDLWVLERQNAKPADA